MNTASSRKPALDWFGVVLAGLGALGHSLGISPLLGWGALSVGLLALLMARGWRPQRNPLDYSLVALAAAAVCSSICSPVPNVTHTTMLFLGASLAGLWTLANWAIDHQRLVVSAASLVLAGVVLALLTPIIVDWNATANTSAKPAIYAAFPLLLSDAVHPNTMASLMATLLPLPLAWLMSSLRCQRVRQHFPKLVLMTGACLTMGLSLILTRSRAGYASALIGGILVIWFSVRKSLRMVSILALGLAGSWAWVGLAGQWDPPRLLGEITDPSTLHFRLEVWKVALLTMSDFPYTGVGMGAFNFVASALYGFRAYSNPGAHSMFLQIAVDLGYPGLIAVLAILISSGRMALRTMSAYQHQGDWELRAITIGVLSGLAAMSLHGLVDNTVWGTRATIVPWLMLGLLTALFLAMSEPTPDHRQC